MKRPGRKLLGILLAVSVLISAVFPMQGYAAEGNGSGHEGTEEALTEGAAAGLPEEGQEPADGGTKPETVGEGQQPTGEGTDPETQDVKQQPAGEGTKPETVGEGQQPMDEGTDPETQDGEQNPEEGTKPEGAENPGAAEEGANPEIIDEGQNPEEGIEPGTPDGEREPAEEKTEPEVLEEGQRPEDGTEPKPLQKEQEPTEGGQEPDGKVPENGQEDGTEPVEGMAQPAEEELETEGAKMGTFMSPQRNGEEDIMPLEDIFDINPPVIESFEFKENGQKLSVIDTLHFSMTVYDSDSGINSITVGVSCNDTSFYRTVTLNKSNVQNLYEGTLSCSELYGNNYYITSIYVEDMRGNYIYADVYDGNYQYLYKFTLDYKKDEVEKDDNVSVSNFQMKTNPSNADGKLRVGDTVTYTADISCKDEELDSVSMELHSSANGVSKWEQIAMAYNADTQKLLGTYTVTSATYPAEWYLYDIDVYTKSGKSYNFYPGSLEPDANVKFEVVQENYDTEKPVIESITIDKNKQEVKAGDVVNIKVKVKEEHPSNAYAYFYPQVSNVSASAYVELKFNADTSEYVGTITITKDTYPCEWALTDLTIYDEIGHSTSLYDFQSNLYDTYPWYYKVRSGNTYREDYKKVTFQFYGLAKQEDGSYQSSSLISAKEVEKVGRRATLKDLGVSFPEQIEGVKTEWRYGGWYWGGR